MHEQTARIMQLPRSNPAEEQAFKEQARTLVRRFKSQMHEILGVEIPELTLFEDNKFSQENIEYLVNLGILQQFALSQQIHPKIVRKLQKADRYAKELKDIVNNQLNDPHLTNHAVAREYEQMRYDPFERLAGHLMGMYLDKLLVNAGVALLPESDRHHHHHGQQAQNQQNNQDPAAIQNMINQMAAANANRR
jgi:hypothetical protein